MAALSVGRVWVEAMGPSASAAARPVRALTLRPADLRQRGSIMMEAVMAAAPSSRKTTVGKPGTRASSQHIPPATRKTLGWADN